MTWRVLELFSGIGGWRAALSERGRVVAAFDIDREANATYARNFGDWPLTRELARLGADELRALAADTWLLSPPCQPFCRQGRHRGMDDPRSAAFRHLMGLFEVAPPERLVLENVPGFLGSSAHELLAAQLTRHGLQRVDIELCSTHFGVPNRRPRAYVLASRHPFTARPGPPRDPSPLRELLDADDDPTLYPKPSELSRHWPGLDLVRPADRRSACFIGGYGQRFVGSGSFLVTESGTRRFSPAEIARLLGMPDAFSFPDGLSRERQYRLLGNGLSIPVARWALGQLDG